MVIREPGIVEYLVVWTGGIVKGLVGMTNDLLAGRVDIAFSPIWFSQSLGYLRSNHDHQHYFKLADCLVEIKL